MTYGDSRFDRLWAAAQDADVPLCLHTTTGAWKKVRFHHPKIRTFVRGEGEIQTSLLEMIYGRVFDRFPALKIVAAEWDIGWVAHMVAKLKDHDPKSGLKLAPAEYFRRNVWFTFENDRAGVLTTPLYGADRFLWASDYPHGATTWPDSRQIVDQQFEGISEEVKHKITRQNAIDLYKLTL
jgi:predicted TIM-barrel fold metal-dependent hydrolase